MATSSKFQDQYVMGRNDKTNVWPQLSDVA